MNRKFSQPGKRYRRGNQSLHLVRWRNGNAHTTSLSTRHPQRELYGGINAGSNPVLTTKKIKKLKNKSYEKNVICSIFGFNNDYLNILACLLYSIIKHSQVAELVDAHSMVPQK